jgi:hypothetical protein
VVAYPYRKPATTYPIHHKPPPATPALIEHSIAAHPAPTAARRGAASTPAPDPCCAQQHCIWRASACRASTSHMPRSRAAPSNPKPSDVLHSSSVMKNEMRLEEAPTATQRALASPKRRGPRIGGSSPPPLPEIDSSYLPCIEDACLPSLQLYALEAADVQTPARRNPHDTTRPTHHQQSRALRRQRRPRCRAVAVRTLRTEYVHKSPPRDLRFRCNHVPVMGILPGRFISMKRPPLARFQRAPAQTFHIHETSHSCALPARPGMPQLSSLRSLLAPWRLTPCGGCRRLRQPSSLSNALRRASCRSAPTRSRH